MSNPHYNDWRGWTCCLQRLLSTPLCIFSIDFIHFILYTQPGDRWVAYHFFKDIHHLDAHIKRQNISRYISNTFFRSILIYLSYIKGNLLYRDLKDLNYSKLFHPPHHQPVLEHRVQNQAQFLKRWNLNFSKGDWREVLRDAPNISKL